MAVHRNVATIAKERAAELARADGRLRHEAATREVVLGDAAIGSIRNGLAEDESRRSSDPGELGSPSGADESTQ